MRVAIIDAPEIVVAGLRTLFTRYPDRVELVEWPGQYEVDVILYGGHGGSPSDHETHLHALLRNTSATVVTFVWNPDGRDALVGADRGVREFLSIEMTADDLVDRIEAVHHDRDRRRVSSLPHPCAEEGRLTSRELDVLTLIASGRSNMEIAADLFLSINTVKTYVRTAYQKIGVQRRAQAVLWVRGHGLGGSLDQVGSMPLGGTESGPAKPGRDGGAGGFAAPPDRTHDSPWSMPTA